MKIIVTGAAQGMGRHFALRLVEAGAKVAAGDVNAEGLATLAEQSGGRVKVHPLDVSDSAQATAFVGWAADAMGGLTGLINNAGILRDGLLVKKSRDTGEITKLSDDDWDKVIAVNLTGATLMARETAAHMIATDQRGVIVNLSSISRYGNRGQSNYAAAKAALAANTKTWALEFARYGIRVGAVAPGMIETPMTGSMKPKTLEAIVAQIPVGRIGKPEDIWRAIQFIIECDYFNGRIIDVDGGYSF